MIVNKTNLSDRTLILILTLAPNNNVVFSKLLKSCDSASLWINKMDILSTS